jgi:hypothetical protein
VPEGEIVETLAPAARLCAEDLLENADALDLVSADGGLDESPGVVKLGLDGNVRLGKFLLVLVAEDLVGTLCSARKRVMNSQTHLELVERERDFGVGGVR